MVMYATVAEVRASFDSLDTAWDAKITECLEAASQAVNRFCNRQFLADVVASPYTFGGMGKEYVYTPEFVAVTEVAVRADMSAPWVAYDVSKYLPFAGDGIEPVFNSLPYQGIMLIDNLFPQAWLPLVRVTAKWGYGVTVPDAVQSAVIALATRWFKRGQGAWADTLASADAGVLIYRQAIDPDVAMLLREGRFIRPSI